MFAYITDKGVKAYTNNILWSTNAQDYIDAGYSENIAKMFASQALSNYGNDNVMIKQAEEITKFSA